MIAGAGVRTHENPNLTRRVAAVGEVTLGADQPAPVVAVDRNPGATRAPRNLDEEIDARLVVDAGRRDDDVGGHARGDP